MKKFFLSFLLFSVHFLFAGENKILPFQVKAENIKFIENKGQWNKNVAYKAEINSGSLFLERGCFTYSFYDNSALMKMHLGEILPESEWKIKHHAFKVRFKNSSSQVKVSASEPSSEYYNYFLGNDRSKWAPAAKAFTKISYSGIYNSTDLKLYTEKGSLKYDIVVSPGGNPSEIKMVYEGTDAVFLRNGELVIRTSVNEVIEQKPYAYQLINGKKKSVKCEFVLNKKEHDAEVSFSIGNFNKSFPLIIDPALIFASYSGSTASNFGMTATYDNAGNFYAGGMAYNNGYPTTIGAFDVTFNNTTTGSTITDVVITKYNSSGSNLVYSTYLGGNGTETAHSIIVNSQDELFLYGVTSSTDFPLSSNAYDTSFGGGASVTFPQNGAGFTVGTDIYVTKFNAAGSALLGSTYIGGSLNDGVNYNNSPLSYDSLQFNYGDQFRGEIMTDDLGSCYIATSTKSTDFPIVNGFQNSLNGSQDAVIFKFNQDLSSLLWSTYLGGSQKDAAYSIKVDPSYNVYVTGGTASPDFPADTSSLNPSYLGGKTDGYVAKISSNGSQLLRATFVGTPSYDQCFFVELDADTNIYLIGQTLDTFAVTPGVYSNPNSPQFIIKLNNAFDSVYYSTVFGNGDLSRVNISPAAFLVDDCQNVYVSGWGASILQGLPLNGMPVTSDAVFSSSPNGFDFYLFVLSRNAASLIYATYFGGTQSREHVDGGTSRFDKRGVVYQSVCAGCGGNSDFPTTPGAWSNQNMSTNCNNGTFKFDFQILPVASLTTSTSDCDSCTGSVSATATGGIPPYTFLWDSVAGNAATPTVTGLCAGTYYLTITDSVGCPSYDSVGIADNSSLAAAILSINTGCADSCNGQITASGTGGASPYSYAWSNSETTGTISGLCEGTYTVTVTDAGNCERVNSASIESPPPLIIASATIANALCADSCNGAASVAGSGGTSPYVYSWSDSQADSSAAGLCAGNISVTITDNNGCIVDTSLAISAPAPMVVSAASSIETCYGLCNGSAIVSASGGTSAYSYLWSNNSISPAISGLCPGTYLVSVTDANNCMKVDSVEINTTDFQSSVSGTDNSNCQNCNGTASVQPVGGASPYSYLWSNSLTAPAISGLCAGTYSVTVTDSTGCDTTITISISDPSNMDLSLADSTDLLCNGVCTGQAITSVTGGTSPFTYTWSNGQTTPAITGLCSGTYFLTLTDVNDCKRFLSVEISEPPQLLVSSLGFTDVSCYGDSNGSAFVNAIGGTSPYSYLWSSGSTQPQAPGLNAQSYTVTITDSNNCVTDTSLTISQPPLLQSLASGSSQQCFLNCDGSVSVSATGGTPAYFYQWSNGSAASTATGLCPGLYVVTITDANGCTKADSSLVDSASFQPKPVSVSADTTTIYEGESTVLHALYDTSANFQWSPIVGLSGANTANPVASPTATTTYFFTVSSPSDPACSYGDSITIFVVEQVCGEPDIFVPNAFTPNNDNNNDKVFVRGNYISEMHFIIYDRWGEKMFETTDQAQGWDGTYKGMKCDPAVFVYHLTVICTDEQEFFKKGNITLIR